MTVSGIGPSTNGLQFSMPSTAAANPDAVQLDVGQMLENAKAQQTGNLLTASGLSSGTGSTTDPASYSQAAIFDMFAQNPSTATMLATGNVPTAASVASAYGTSAGTGGSASVAAAGSTQPYDPFAAVPTDTIDGTDPFATSTDGSTDSSDPDSGADPGSI